MCKQLKAIYPKLFAQIFSRRDIVALVKPFQSFILTQYSSYVFSNYSKIYSMLSNADAHNALSSFVHDIDIPSENNLMMQRNYVKGNETKDEQV